MYAKTTEAPIEVRKTAVNNRYVSTAGVVLLGAGAGVVLGQTVKTKHEKEESMSSDDEHRLRAAKKVVKKTLEKIQTSIRKSSQPKSYLDQLSVNTQGRHDGVHKYVDDLPINTQEHHAGMESYVDHLSSIAKEPPPSIGLIRSSSANDAQVKPVVEVKSPTVTPEPAASNKEAPEMPVTKLPPKPLASPVIQSTAVSTAAPTMQEPANVPAAKEAVQNTFSTFSPKTLREETKHIIEETRHIVEATPKKIQKETKYIIKETKHIIGGTKKKALSRKYEAIDSLEERAFAILRDLGMIELHPDPSSPQYDNSMDDKFVE